MAWKSRVSYKKARFIVLVACRRVISARIIKAFVEDDLMPEPMSLPTAPEDGRYRVLVVDDDPFIGRLVMSNLSKANLNCRLAADGVDGMVEFKNFNPHLVLSDIMMPGMDGRQLCSTIRSISMVPIILMTAADTSEAELAAFKAGADDYIPKPFDPTLLMTRVIATMRRVYRYDSQAHAQSSAPPTPVSAPAAAQSVSAPGASTVQIITCKSCGYKGTHDAFRRENSRGQRYVMCPHCQEMEHFAYSN
jgi:DNA-binding response OmpR family regulator